MKAVILAGSPGTAMFPLANYYSKLAFPVANEPIIYHLLSFLEASNILEAVVILPGHSSWWSSTAKVFKNSRVDGIKVSVFEEKRARGTAGCLKEIAGFIGSSPFLVISPNVFTGNLDLSEAFSAHKSQGATVTVVVERSNDYKNGLENIEIGQDGIVKRFHILHPSKDNRRILLPTGFYIFNSSVLETIPAKGYMDIKEQLIPEMAHKGFRIYAHELTNPVKKIDSLSNYFQLNRDVLSNGFMSRNRNGYSKSEIMEGVWVGKNVRISPNAYLLGPVVIGSNCTVEDYAQIIGPTSIGEGTHIEKDVLVRESIIWEKAELMSNSRIEHSLIGEKVIIRKNERVKNKVVIQDNKFNKNFNVLSSDHQSNCLNNGGNDLFTTSYKRWKYRTYLTSKRLFDFLLSFLCLFTFLPVFLITTIFIKIDSPGPVIFCQRRCGKDGKEFKMYKFRTMVRDAEKLHEKFLKKNILDGPMFKMKKDPRITKVGRFLRKTSLDELPQILNVLKGEMSLVGPRPLAMEEMKFSPSWRDLRLKVKPGITGQWQVSGRSGTLFDDWIRHDIYYVKNQSIWLDIKLLMKTVVMVFKREGAF